MKQETYLCWTAIVILTVFVLFSCLGCAATGSGTDDSLSGIGQIALNAYNDYAAKQKATADAKAKTVADAKAVVDAQRAASQSILSMSPRLGSLKIPDTMAPTIKINSYDLSGDLTFESTTCGGGKVPSTGGYEYIIVTTDGNTGGDSASSHGVRDSRWNKYYGQNLKAFAIFLVTNRNTVIEYSEAKEILN